MTESSERGKPDDAILQLMVEFRNMWLAQEEAQPDPMPSPPSTSRRRAGVLAVLLVFVAAAALAYVGSVVWDRSGALVRQAWFANGGTAASPPAGEGPRNTPPVTTRVADVPPPEASQPAAVTPVTAVVTPSPTPAGYHVQVGAFNVLEYAHDMMRQLRARDYSVTLVEAPTGPPHRVWIGGVFDQAAAARVVNRLRNDGFEAILVRE